MVLIWVVNLLATDFAASIPPGYITVPPSTQVTFNLVIAGCDRVEAYINGTPTGILRYPYTVSFLSAPSGTNTIQIVVCDWANNVITNSYTILSVTRTYAKRARRS